MALIACKECGSEVSTEAKTCPKCGVTLKKSRWFRNVLVGLLMAVALFAGTGILVGKVSSKAAIAAIEEREGVVPGSVAISKYRRSARGEEEYVCGIATVKKSNGSTAPALWYVVQAGMFLSVVGSGLDGDKDFDALYQIACGKYS